MEEFVILSLQVSRDMKSIAAGPLSVRKSWKPGHLFRSEEKKGLKIKFLGGIFLGHPGPRHRDIPDTNFMQVAFFCCFRQGVAGMSRDLGRDVPDLEKLYARKLWADFSYPTYRPLRTQFFVILGARLPSTALLVGRVIQMQLAIPSPQLARTARYPQEGSSRELRYPPLP